AAALRLSARSGADATASALLSRLVARPAWRSETARAALFLAASDLVRGRGDDRGRLLAGARDRADRQSASRGERLSRGAAARPLPLGFARRAPPPGGTRPSPFGDDPRAASGGDRPAGRPVRRLADPR